jgi:hypothetical protein
MDLSLPLMGILGIVGYNLNRYINSREYISKRNTVSESDKPSGDTIYESKTYNKTRDQEQTRLDKFYNDSKDISNTNKYTEAYSTKVKSSGSEDIVRFDSRDSNKDTKKILNGDKVHVGPMFNSGKYFIPESSGKDFETNENFSNISALSGQATDYSHSNQTPFFGSHIKGSNSGVMLEKFTGSDKISKSEVGTLLNGPENIYAQQSFTTTVDPSVFSNMLTKTQNNVLPFDQLKIQPIPQEHTRIEPKTVDSLRTLNNPKTSYEGRTIIGSSRVAIHKNNTGVLQKVKIGRYYKNSKERYLVTGGQDKSSYVDNSRVDFRKSRKTSAVESKHNLGAGTDYRLGELQRLTETEDGINQLFNEGTTKTANKNEWIKSRGSRVSQFDGQGIMDNIYVPEQERQTSSRFNIGAATNTEAGERIRYTNEAKTTNKESTLYSYIGTGSTQNSPAPESREQYYNAETKTKESRGYTPGGASQFANSVGVESINVSNKIRPEYTWNGPAKDNSKQSLNQSQIGSERVSNLNSETDFTERFKLQTYPNK